MDSEEFKAEIRNTLRRIETNVGSIDTRARLDHDTLTMLNQSVIALTDSMKGYRDQLADHEKRIRLLERGAYGLLAVILVLQFILSKILK